MKKDKKKDRGGKGDGGVDFGKYLRGMNKHLEKAKERASEGGFEEYADGKYRMRCVNGKVGVSKNKRVQVVLTWKFMDGDYKGKEKLDFEGLTEDHLPYLLRKLDAMGYDTTELEDLEAELRTILEDIKKTKPKCKATLKTKGDFQNLYVDHVLGEDEEEEEEEDDEEEGESDADDDDADEVDEDEDDEDDKKKKKGKKDKKKEKKEDDDEDEDEDSDDEDSDDSDDDDEEEDDDKKKTKGKKKTKDDDDEDDEAEDEEDDEEEEAADEVDVVVGSKVTADSKKEGRVKGTVVELFEAEGKVLLKTGKGKTLKISADKIVSVDENPAAVVPKKKKK